MCWMYVDNKSSIETDLKRLSHLVIVEIYMLRL